MNYRERMREYLKEPDEYSSQYGKWGALNREQRQMITRLLNEMDRADEAIKHQFFEIERLHSIIKEVREYINHYETIRGYYEYEELGYDEYNYDEDVKQKLLGILDKVEKENDIEFDVLKALNTDLDDDVEMG